MSYKTCEDCGTKLYSGACSNCHEETFIEQQNYESDEPIIFSEDFINKLEIQKQQIRENVKRLYKIRQSIS